FESYALTPQYQASSKYAKPEAHDNIAYTGNKQDAWNTLISYHVQRALVQRLGGPDRGLKRARFLVLKHLDCPGVLVELGFVSHPDTAQKLRTAAFRQTLAQSLFEGIVAYRNRLARIQ
ncbi:MAG: N-acetylmuramoyl-L-alanine amidase, partial [Opitutales bacterium]|nr:N-acetylmuramoyl-L-alanine amidase [Opitutales bacterium]